MIYGKHTGQYMALFPQPLLLFSFHFLACLAAQAS